MWLLFKGGGDQTDTHPPTQGGGTRKQKKSAQDLEENRKKKKEGKNNHLTMRGKCPKVGQLTLVDHIPISSICISHITNLNYNKRIK